LSLKRWIMVPIAPSRIKMRCAKGRGAGREVCNRLHGCILGRGSWSSTFPNNTDACLAFIRFTVAFNEAMAVLRQTLAI
jgi:hypothetical protein